MTSQHGVNSNPPNSPQDTPIKDILKAFGEEYWSDIEHSDGSHDISLKEATQALESYINNKVKEARIDELEQSIPRLARKLKTNADVGTGDYGGFNAGVKAVSQSNIERILELKSTTKELEK